MNAVALGALALAMALCTASFATKDNRKASDWLTAAAVFCVAAMFLIGVSS